MKAEISFENPVQTSHQAYFEKGIDYKTYQEELSASLVEPKDERLSTFAAINQQRMKRISKTYQVSEEIKHLIESLPNKVRWLVLTEHWCGDAAQILPVLHKISEESNGKIELKLLYRDQNLALMDQYLTNNGRAIPKVIQLDSDFDAISHWGPRPQKAQELVKKLKSDPTTATNYATELQLWYAKDKQNEIETEILNLLLQTKIY